MPWLLDEETGDVYDPEGNLIGQTDGPPFTIPRQIREVAIEESLPAPQAAVQGEDLNRAISITSDNVDFGIPEDDNN